MNPGNWYWLLLPPRPALLPSPGHVLWMWGPPGQLKGILEISMKSRRNFDTLRRPLVGHQGHQKRQKCNQNPPSRVSNGGKNRSCFDFGGKRGFCNPSHAESLFSGVQGTPKVMKIRMKIGFPNKPSSQRRFFGSWAPRVAKKSAKAPQRVPQGTPEGRPKR